MNVPAEPLPLERFYERSRESFEDIVRYADSEEAVCMSHSELERELEKDPEEVIEEAFGEALCRDPGREKKWVALVDGNKTKDPYPLKRVK
jgi:hypothetical protein